MDRDKLMNGEAEDILQATYSVLSRVQDLDKVKQVQAGAVFLSALCEVLELDPKDMIQMGQRVIRIARKERLSTMNALEQYLEGELK